MTKQCELCNREFIPRQADQRFCCRDCSIDWYQEERRQAVAAFRLAQAQPIDEAVT
jgi:hypothetical protein